MLCRLIPALRKMSKDIKERIAREGMEGYFGQILVPVEEVVDIKKWSKNH